MKIKKLISAIVFAVTLSIMSANSVFAITAVNVDDFTWIETDDKWSCIDEDGDLVKGWVSQDQDIYYLDKEGILKTGWIKYDRSWYYLDEDTGILTTDQWVDNYYVNYDGEMSKIR